MTTFNGTTANLRSKAKKHVNLLSKMNIKCAMVICLQIFCFTIINYGLPNVFPYTMCSGLIKLTHMGGEVITP